MKRILVAAMCMTAVAAFADRATAADTIPAWAYPVNPPGLQRAPDDGIPRHVPNSTATYSVTQIRDLFTPPDWHPSSHPAMPDVVGRGRKPGQFACGFCHLPNGLGRPENSSLAGLSADYIAQQVADFKSGARRSSEPAKSAHQSDDCRGSTGQRGRHAHRQRILPRWFPFPGFAWWKRRRFRRRRWTDGCWWWTRGCGK